MTELTSLTLAEARDRLKSRAISSLEITKAHLEAMARAKALNAFVATTADKALQMAEASDARIAKGEGGPLEGLPIGVKDLYATKDVHTQACSHILDGFKPPYELTVTANLWRDGAVMLGKLNMDEFAMGSSNETSCLWACRFALAAAELEPRQGARGASCRQARPPEPGGSSGGSSAAVAARLCLAATASDTGGSIRQPAAFTGIVGIKPTYGRCSRYGMVAFASSLDQAGPLARTVRDAAIMLRSMAGPDAERLHLLAGARPRLRSRRRALGEGHDDRRAERISPRGDEQRNRGAVGAAAPSGSAPPGAKVVDVSLPNTPYALPAYYIVAPAEASSNLARYDGVRYGLREPAADIIELYEKTRAMGFGAEVRRRLMIGTYVLSAGYYDAYYVRAQKIRTLIKRDFERVFADGVDAILTPATPSAAFGIGEKGAENPVEMYLNDVFTVTVNMAGLPGLVAPAGLSSDGLPLGLQLIGRPFDEETLFALGETIEQSAGRMTLPEPWWALSRPCPANIG